MNTDMTYWQTFKILFVGLILVPIDADRIEEIVDGLWVVICALFRILLRLIVLITFPLSVPLIAWYIQSIRRQTRERRRNAKLKRDNNVTSS
jgi:hypothetical protein